MLPIHSVLLYFSPGYVFQYFWKKLSCRRWAAIKAMMGRSSIDKKLLGSKKKLHIPFFRRGGGRSGVRRRIEGNVYQVLDKKTSKQINKYRAI